MLNTHPALLPAFKGWHAVRDALAAGVADTGCTVHIATLEVDSGPILAQEAVAGAARRRRGHAARTHQRSRTSSLPGHHQGRHGRNTAVRALLSVWDKTGLVALAKGLEVSGLGADRERQHLQDAGRGEHRAHRRRRRSPARPRCSAGASRRCTPRSTAASSPTGPSPNTSPISRPTASPGIDLVVCNLYPFRSDPSIEMIDIGGPTMVRAAAKNHDHVGIVVEPGGLRRRARRAAQGRRV